MPSGGERHDTHVRLARTFYELDRLTGFEIPDPNLVQPACGRSPPPRSVGDVVRQAHSVSVERYRVTAVGWVHGTRTYRFPYEQLFAARVYVEAEEQTDLRFEQHAGLSPFVAR